VIEPLHAPRLLGRYRVVRLLGQGGMGSVYLAEDTQLGRQVAVKVPHQSMSNSGTLRARLIGEARAAAAIDHPNLCPIYDVGEDQGIPYLVMPFVAGTPLSSLIGPEHFWEPARALALVYKVALAVGAAHARNVIHRDLKPGNIMVRPGDDPLVMDFGLARQADDCSRPLTHSGALGTPAYMSPEQMEDARTVGPSTDVYALGVILYELLTGQRPFDGSLPVLCGQVLFMEPGPPSSLRPGLPQWLDAVCLKALAKRPEHRYLSMDAFSSALKPSPTARPTDHRPAPVPVVPALRIHPVGNVLLEPGQCKMVEVRVSRHQCPGRIELWLEGRTPGVPLGTGEIAAGSDHTVIKLRAGVQTRPGPRIIRLHARSPLVQTVIPVQVMIAQVPLPGEIVNSLGMNFVLVRPGSFPQSESGDSEREPEIGRPFYVGVSEVTKGQYERIMGLAREGDDSVRSETISWGEAEEFCERLSALEQEKWTARSYRLPTEMEWEYACRDEAATSKPFQFCGSFQRQVRIDWGHSCVVSAAGSYLRRTSAIGSLPGNGQGESADAGCRQGDGDRGISEGDILRGGSWLPVGWYCHSAFRGRGRVARNVYAGFRVVCVVRTA
jgi:serine/threonine protein kinase/formylglycine-generating enzyme required for sulfatase activity